MPQATKNPHERISDEERVKTLTGIWRVLPFCVYSSSSGTKIHIFPLRLGLWLIGGAVFGYLGIGTALYSHDRYYLGLKGISLADRLYPPNWPSYSEARGNSYLAKAQQSLVAGKFPQAFHEVKSGLARAPRNLDGRLLFAEMLQMAGRIDLCEGVLLNGLEFHGTDPDYVRKCLTFLFQHQRDAAVIQLANDLLPSASEVTVRPTGQGLDRDLLLSIALANAYFYRGNFDQAEAVIEKYGLVSQVEGRFISAKIEWERGYRLLALTLIEQLSKEFPDNPSFYQTVVQWQLAESRTDSARRTSLLRRISYPDQFQPRIDLLYAYEKSSDDTAAAREIAEYFRDFSTDSAAMLVLGDFAANTGNPSLAQRIFDHAAGHDIPLQAPALMLVEAHIVSQNYDAAIKLTQNLLKQHPEWEQQFAPVFNGLQAIANYALGAREEASLYLNSFLNLPNARAENLVAVAQRLQSVGARAESRRVLTQAIQTDPLNQLALARLIEFELAEPESPNLANLLQRMLEMRRPSPELLTLAYTKLGLDRYLFLDGRDDILNRIRDVLSGQATISN